MTLLAYVINLDRRPDRFRDFEDSFAGSSFEINRVSAVDGSLLPVSPYLPLSSAEQACWLSHLRVIDKFIESGEDHCLVFEDDAVPSTPSFVEIDKTLSQVVIAMKQHSIPFVQLGHIEYLYQIFSRQGLGHRVMQLGLGFGSRTLRINSSHKLFTGQCRAGTHALLLSREAALALHRTNDPPMFSADEYFMALAQKSIIGSSHTLRLATVVPTLFHQASRSGRRILDSDIANLS